MAWGRFVVLVLVLIGWTSMFSLSIFQGSFETSQGVRSVVDDEDHTELELTNYNSLKSHELLQQGRGFQYFDFAFLLNAALRPLSKVHLFADVHPSPSSSPPNRPQPPSSSLPCTEVGVLTAHQRAALVVHSAVGPTRWTPEQAGRPFFGAGARGRAQFFGRDVKHIATLAKGGGVGVCACVVRFVRMRHSGWVEGSYRFEHRERERDIDTDR